MVDSKDFSRVVRSGVRSATPRLVIHYGVNETDHLPKVGFVVPKKAIAKAVNRNLVKRRLRHLVSKYLGTFPPGTDLVIRVLGPAGVCSKDNLASDLEMLICNVQVKFISRVATR